MADTVSSSFGPLRFRVPLLAADRVAIVNADAVHGTAIANWPHDALAITGIWPAPLNRPLTVRPIFPGAMRFVASNPTEIPSSAQIDVVAGRVTNDCLDRMALTGTLIIRLQQSGHMTEMRKVGAIGAIGEAPTHALYGPVLLSREFLRDALLDFNRGMLAAPIFDGLRVVKPGDTDWEALALRGFLNADYEPMLRAGSALDLDDAGRCPMPEVVQASDRTFALGVALGWMRDARTTPVSPNDSDLEIIPTVAFLRHIAARVREPVRDADNVDPLMSKLFANETDSNGWTDRLRAQLSGIGFGALDNSLQLEQVLREFQIAATRPITATAKDPLITPQQLARRQFGDLKAAANTGRYFGHISGRANQQTRMLISYWESAGLRCPLLIVAYNKDDLDQDEKPMPGRVSVHTDLWSRFETRDRTLRMFAADFTRLLPDGEIAEDTLELIGFYVPYDPPGAPPGGGPCPLEPKLSRRVEFAEVLPDRLLGVDENTLIAALPARPGDRTGALASTFKVVRAVSEFECVGYLDQINAYDNAGISYGLCHWAMAHSIGKPTDPTELGAVAAYFHYLEAGPIARNVDVFKGQGLTCAEFPSEDPRAMARYTDGGVYRNQLCFIDDRGNPRDMAPDGPRDMVPSWRSYYRWVVIGRHDEHIGPATWSMAVRRLHALLATPIETTPPSTAPGGGQLTIGSVFTSELVVAQLMRWHVKTPGVIVQVKAKIVGKKNGKEIKSEEPRAAPRIVEAYQAAASVAVPGSAAWASALIAALRDQLDDYVSHPPGAANDKLPENFDDLADPQWIRPPPPNRNTHAYGLNPRLRQLSSAEGSFQLAPPIAEP